MPSRCEHRPDIGIAEQLVGGFLHEQQIARIGADSAEDAENRLHEERRLNDLLFKAISQIVEMPHVVAFKFEARPGRLAEALDDPSNVAEGVAEYVIIRAIEI